MEKNKIRIDENSFRRLESRAEENTKYVKHSFWNEIKRELQNNKLAKICLGILLIVVVLVLLSPLSPYDPYEADATQKLLNPSMAHWFGTDEYGRDYFTRILYGGRVSLLIGFASMAVTVVIGSAIGICAGYIGGKLDMILMRFTDVFLAMPKMYTKGKTILNTIEGNIPDMTNLPKGCAFCNRCPYAMNICKEYEPLKTICDKGHEVSCWLQDDRADITGIPYQVRGSIYEE